MADRTLVWKRVESDGYLTVNEAYIGDGMWVQVWANFHPQYPNSKRVWEITISEVPFGSPGALDSEHVGPTFDTLTDAKAWVWHSIGGHVLA